MLNSTSAKTDAANSGGGAEVEVLVVTDVDDDVGVVELDLTCAETPLMKHCRSIYA